MSWKRKLWWWWARRNICKWRGHAWTGGMFLKTNSWGQFGRMYSIYCHRCDHHLTDSEARNGEPARFLMPRYGDIRRRNGGPLYETNTKA